MTTMRRTDYTLTTPSGPVQVTVYRDLQQAFVLFEGLHAFNRVDELAPRVRDLYLEYLPEDEICWVVRQTSRSGTQMVRQVHVRWTDGRAFHPTALRRTPEELEAILAEIDRQHPHHPGAADTQDAPEDEHTQASTPPATPF